MKKLLIASAALALSTSFAFASVISHPSIPTIKVSTGDNWSKISNTVNHNKWSDITVANGVNQNTGIQIPVTVIVPHGPGSDLGSN